MPSIRPTVDKSVQLTLQAAADLRLQGLRAAVVGGTGGLGRAIARQLATQGARVTVVGQTFRDDDIPGIDFLRADLSVMAEAARVADQLPAEDLDLLILTTGIMAAHERQQTVEGLERDMAVSYLSRLVIVHRLADRLGIARPAASASPRVFIMGFPGVGATIDLDDLNAEKTYESMSVHYGTVAGNEALVTDSATRYPSVSFFGLNPGFVGTNIRSNMYGTRKAMRVILEGITRVLAPSPERYASRIVPVLVAKGLQGRSGLMFGSKGQAILASPEATPEHAARVVQASVDLVQRVAPGAI